MNQRLELLRESLSESYEVLSEVGSGARAVVFLARDLKHDRQVALKVLRPEFVASVGTARFLKEIGIAAKMTHPHILPLYDSGEVKGILYYVMPYVEGETLRDRIDAEGPLPVLEAVQLTRQISDALAHAHRNGVVHRDIKPANILLEDGKAVVADFGIAQTLSDSAELTAAGASIGTPNYMSPEQSSGQGDVDARTDIYSLGCVLFEMLVGRPPFRGRVVSEVLAQHLGKPPPSVISQRKDVPVWLDSTVLKMLAKNPENRFETAVDLSEELAGYLGPAGGFSNNPLHRLAYRAWRNRRPLLGGAFAIVLVGLAYWAYLESRRRTRTPPDPSQIAVLCFEDRTQDGSLEAVASGLSRALIRSLDTHEALEVVSYSGIRPYCSSEISLDSLARALSVGLVVSGSILSSGGQLRTEFELANPADSRLLESETVTVPLSDYIGLVDGVVGRVERSLRPWIGQEVRLREGRAGTNSADAWEFYETADVFRRKAKDQLLPSPAAAVRNLETAGVFADSAIRVDPAWVDPYLESGWISLELADLALAGNPLTPPDTAQHVGLLEKAEARAQSVLERHSSHPGALGLRAGVYSSRSLSQVEDPDPTLLDSAEADLRAAVAQDPGRAEAWGQLSTVLIQNGRPEEAAEAAEAALEEDAYFAEGSGVLYRLFLVHLEAGREPEAWEWCSRAGTHYPGVREALHCELRFLAHAERAPPDTARARELDVLLREKLGGEGWPFDPYFGLHNRLLLAAVQAKAGNREGAEQQVSDVQDYAVVNGLNTQYEFDVAWVQILLENPDGAILALAEFLRSYPAFRSGVAGARSFQSLTEHPDFIRLIGGADVGKLESAPR